MSERGPYAKGRERREAILKTTLDVFATTGYRKSSLRAIAREVGIGPTLLQHYFHSREELLTEVVKAWDAENQRRGAHLSSFGHWLKGIRHNTTIPGLVHLYTAFAVEAIDPDHPSRQFFKERYESFTQELAGDIARLKGLGRAPAGADPERVARALIAACEGLQIRWLHEPSFDMYDEFLFILDQFGIKPTDDHPENDDVEPLPGAVRGSKTA